MVKRIAFVMVFVLLAGVLLAADAEPGKKELVFLQGAEPFIALAVGFGLAFAAAFGALGQAKAISASVEAMARQPEIAGRIFTSMMIGLALIESLVIYSLVISFLLLGKLH